MYAFVRQSVQYGNTGNGIWASRQSFSRKNNDRLHMITKMKADEKEEEAYFSLIL